MKIITLLRPILFVLAAGIHLALIFTIAFTMPVKTKDAPKPAAKTIRLIHIQEIQEAPPVTPAQTRPPAPPQKPQPAPEVSAETPAEIFVEREEEPVSSAGPETAPADIPISAVSAPASNSPKPKAKAPAPGDGALKKAYIRKNFAEIQRRIKDRLRYPAQARRAGVQGAAEVVFTIHQDGTISGLAIQMTSGQALLDQAALEAVAAAAPFRPAPDVQTRLVVPVSFKLR
ncbi:MAG: TonB family protein [Treponema sp.]|jgi:protein TonB|nr:TonB family protein [Treponema sp.]